MGDEHTPVTVLVVLHFLHYSLVFQCCFLCFNFPSCSCLNFERKVFGHPNDHQKIIGSKFCFMICVLIQQTHFCLSYQFLALLPNQECLTWQDDQA